MARPRGRNGRNLDTRHRTLPERTGDAGDVQELRGHLGHGLTDCRSALPRYPRHAAGAMVITTQRRRGRESGTVARHDLHHRCAPSGSRSPRRGRRAATLPARRSRRHGVGAVSAACDRGFFAISNPSAVDRPRRSRCRRRQSRSGVGSMVNRCTILAGDLVPGSERVGAASKIGEDGLSESNCVRSSKPFSPQRSARSGLCLGSQQFRSSNFTEASVGRPGRP